MKKYQSLHNGNFLSFFYVNLLLLGTIGRNSTDKIYNNKYKKFLNLNISNVQRY